MSSIEHLKNLITFETIIYNPGRRIMSKITLRIDRETPGHIYFTVFQDHGNAGSLVFQKKFFKIFLQGLKTQFEFDLEVLNEDKIK